MVAAVGEAKFRDSAVVLAGRVEGAGAAAATSCCSVVAADQEAWVVCRSARAVRCSVEADRLEGKANSGAVDDSVGWAASHHSDLRCDGGGHLESGVFVDAVGGRGRALLPPCCLWQLL